MTYFISCRNCGRCEDTECLCNKCLQGRRKRAKIQARSDRRNNRAQKYLVENKYEGNEASIS